MKEPDFASFLPSAVLLFVFKGNVCIRSGATVLGHRIDFWRKMNATARHKSGIVSYLHVIAVSANVVGLMIVLE
jgi:hypothetical protein